MGRGKKMRLPEKTPMTNQFYLFVNSILQNTIGLKKQKKKSSQIIKIHQKGQKAESNFKMNRKYITCFI